MKKLKFLIAFLTLSLLTLSLAACSGALEAPQKISIDENYSLSWNSVDDARGYIVEVTDVSTGIAQENETRRSPYSLATLAEGDYEVRVKTVGGRQNSVQSAWSQTLSLHKDYESGCVYTLINNNTEYRLESGGTATGSFVIEDVYRGKPVTEIAEGAFRGKVGQGLENVTIGNNVTTIGDNAFYQCLYLQSIVIPDSVVSIGEGAFLGCKSLTTVTLPAKLTTLETGVFNYCSNLETVVFNDCVTSIGESAFYGCTSLKSVVVPDSVVTVGEYAFGAETALAEVTLGKSLTTIGDHAFYGCEALAEVNFAQESALTEIGEYAFSKTALQSVELPEGLTSIGDSCFNNSTQLASAEIPSSVVSVGRSAFNGTVLYESQQEDGFIYVDGWLTQLTSDATTNLKKIVLTQTDEEGVVALKDGTVGIADYTLSFCSNLSNVVLPSSVKYLGQYSFYRNLALRTVTFSENGVEVIGRYAFCYCEILSRVNLNEGLREIGSYAFYLCTMLQSDDSEFMPSTVERVGTYAFNDTAFFNNPDSYGVVYVGDWVVGYSSVTSAVTLKLDDDHPISGIADYAFYNCTDLQSIGLGSIRIIGKGAFYGCSNLFRVTLNDNMTTIEPYTFFGCTSLHDVTFPQRLVSIGNCAFYGCSGLYALDFSETALETIDDNAFYGCSNIQTIDFGNVKSIGAYAFFKCTSLGVQKEEEEEEEEKSLYTLVLPDSLTSLGDGAFARCENLVDVQIGSGLTSIPDYAFRNCTSLLSITIPEGVTSVGRCAFFKCTLMNEISLPQSLQSIGAYAFYGDSYVKSLVISENVTSIGAYAFRGTSSLTSLVMLGTEKTIGTHAFFGATSMTIYAEATEEEAADWGNAWNTSFRPILWGCTFEGESAETYVVSVTSEISYPYAWGGVADPVREGYTFEGWTEDETSGVKTAVWQQAEEENSSSTTEEENSSGTTEDETSGTTEQTTEN